jgi:hypothetical protein
MVVCIVAAIFFVTCLVGFSTFLLWPFNEMKLVLWCYWCNATLQEMPVHWSMSITDFSCYIISWVLVQDGLFYLLKCFVYIGSLIWYLLIPVLIFCDSRKSLMLPYKYEFSCCLLIDACALAACQNTDFGCWIATWLQNLLYEFLVLIRIILRALFPSFGCLLGTTLEGGCDFLPRLHPPQVSSCGSLFLFLRAMS